MGKIVFKQFTFLHVNWNLSSIDNGNFFVEKLASWPWLVGGGLVCDTDQAFIGTSTQLATELVGQFPCWIRYTGTNCSVALLILLLFSYTTSRSDWSLKYIWHENRKGSFKQYWSCRMHSIFQNGWQVDQNFK